MRFKFCMIKDYSPQSREARKEKQKEKDKI
jgi:hypothetical protein